MKRKTEAQKILEARRGSYGESLPGGYVTETEALLMQQDFQERFAAQKKRRAAKQPRRNK